MGKGTLLLVGAVILSGTYLMISQQRSVQDTRQAQSKYEYTTLARNAAHSGFDHAMSEIRRNKSTSSLGIEDETDGRPYTASIDEYHGYGDMTVLATGTAGGAEHEVKANVIYETPVDAALGLDADSVTFRGHDSYIVSGHDMRSQVSGQRGFLKAVPGIRSRMTDPDENAHPDHVKGEGGEWVTKEPGFDYKALYAQAINDVGPDWDDSGDELEDDGGSFGSENDPKIVRVTGDVDTYESIEGYGLLIIENGDLDAPNLDWNGIVLVRKKRGDDLEIELEDDARVQGSLMAYEYGSLPSGDIECDPDFQIDGDVTLPEDPFYVKVDVLGTGISMGGEYDIPVTAQVQIGNETFEPWGDYDDPASGNLNVAGQEHFVFNPKEPGNPDQRRAFPGGTPIRINAQSWVRDGKKYVEKEREKKVCTEWEGHWLWRECVEYEERTVTEDVWEGDYHWREFMERDSDSNGPNLQVLEDGSDAPDKDAYLDQTSAQEYVSDYISEDGDKIKLQLNQSINLFELGMPPSQSYSDAFDMQDLVATVSIMPVDPTDCHTTATAATGKLDVEMDDDATVQYSPEAIAKLGQRLGMIQSSTQVVIAKRKETAK